MIRVGYKLINDDDDDDDDDDENENENDDDDEYDDYRDYDNFSPNWLVR